MTGRMAVTVTHADEDDRDEGVQYYHGLKNVEHNLFFSVLIRRFCQEKP